MTHSWESTRCTRSYGKESCLICDAVRVRNENTNWQWLYRKGGPTCFTPAGRGDPTEGEKRLARNKWEGPR